MPGEPREALSHNKLATLEPGDLILTGSPGGSGPLITGDIADITIDVIGTLTTTGVI